MKQFLFLYILRLELFLICITDQRVHNFMVEVWYTARFTVMAIIDDWYL